MTMNKRIYYSMTELGQVFGCSRVEALDYVRANRLLTVRRLGDTYICEDELVRHLMERHKLARG